VSPRLPAASSDSEACDPQYPARICAFYYERNPWPYYGPLEQIGVDCDDTRIVNADRCVTFSFDPLSYSPDTWAYCCVPDPSMVLR